MSKKLTFYYPTCRLCGCPPDLLRVLPLVGGWGRSECMFDSENPFHTCGFLFLPLLIFLRCRLPHEIFSRNTLQIFDEPYHALDLEMPFPSPTLLFADILKFQTRSSILLFPTQAPFPKTRDGRLEFCRMQH